MMVTRNLWNQQDNEDKVRTVNMSDKKKPEYRIAWMKVLRKLSIYNIKKGLLYLRHYGLKEFWFRMKERFQAEAADYGKWYENHKASEEELAKQRKEHFAKEPLISILVPVYNTPREFLIQLLRSVGTQTYHNWELCIANASVDNKGVIEVLEHYQEKTKRLKVINVPENEGISQNTNKALSIASGEYVALLDHDDLLSPNALYEIVKVINNKEDADVIYTDEDKVTADLKEHFQPHFKPDFSEDLLRSNNYICHFFVAKREIVNEVGGFHPEFNGAQDYDLIFRCTEKARGIYHVPKILYHWRTHKASTADNPASKMYAFDAGKRAIEEHLKRVGEKGEVSHTKDLGFYRVKYPVIGNPKVSIIIPNKDEIAYLEKCIHSIREKTDYKNYEIIVVENNSEKSETFEFYKKIERDWLKVIYWDREFNYSAINNFGVRHATGDYLLFLNNDVEVINSDWMTEMLSHCQRKHVGVVGAKLYYPDNTIQHAGIVIGIGGIAGNMFTGMSRSFTGYLHKASIQQDLSAVTAACMMVERHAFEKVKGFEEDLAVAFNDVDFCLKIRKAGYLIVYNPNAELYHYESKTRGKEDTKEKLKRFQGEIDYMKERWSQILEQGDPYYNVNFSLIKCDYSLKNNDRKS